VAVAFLCELVSFGTGSAAFSVLLRPMSEDLGWNRTVLSGAVTLQALGNIGVTPIAGYVVDRWGPRAIIVLGSLVSTMGFIAISQVTEPWHFYVLYALSTVLGLNELGSLVTSTTVAKWFVRRRGRAMSLGSIGLNAGGIIMAPVVAILVTQLGWRSTWSAMGIIVLVTVVPAALFFFRRRPEDMGLLPDGDSPHELSAVQQTGSGRPPEHQWTVSAALHTRTTWLLVVAFNCILMAAAAMSQHTISYLLDTGLTLTEATAIFAFTHVITIGSKLVWGTLSDRIPVRYCLVISNLARMSGLLCLLLGWGQWRLWGYVVGAGIGQGMGLLQPKLWADYYGRTFLGTIRGVLQPFSVMASLAGPLFAAYIYDTTGSYTQAFWVLVGGLVISTGLMYIARPPGPPTAKVIL
jgi:sugar phosphate permease